MEMQRRANRSEPDLRVAAVRERVPQIRVETGDRPSLGVQPPQAEWGAMVSSGRQVLLDQWWVATIPGIAIFVTSLGFNLLGDGLRDVADSRSA